MRNESWHLNRRTFLLGSGVSLGLPWLECMADHAAATAGTRPARFCALYFGFGVSVGDDSSEHAHWRWFPNGEGKDYQFNESLKPLEPLRDQLTVLGGLSHPHGRTMGGHDTGDTFLTGALMDSRSLANSVSIDQVVAGHWDGQTRFRSLVMSTDGGIGAPTRSSTLSYNQQGRPIPALNEPQRIFARLFGAGDDESQAENRRLLSEASMLDRLLDDSRSLMRRLGHADQAKLDEYLESVRESEKRVANAQKWLEVPRRELNDDERKLLDLDADDQAPIRYIQTMYDLIYLAFLTDSTRVATYQITNMADASSRAMKFPQLLGFTENLHKTAHSWNKPGGIETLGRWDRIMTEQFAHFIDRLSSAESDGGSLLDDTIVLYGSSNSQTHVNNNYPLILAGGKRLGLSHGSFRKFGEEVPLSNLFVTALACLDVPSEGFADSTGEISELRNT